MCAHCKATAECDCTGGSMLATCACNSGDYCPVCNHDTNANTAAEAALGMELLGTDMIAGLD
jgi:hypothetical protein